jgi:protein tyrosine/serine phosphatase
MIHRFIKVTDGLYRGSAPSPNDVIQLKMRYGIKKIVSLDKETGDAIDKTCKLLNIEHIMVPLDGQRRSLLGFLHHNLKTLFLKGGPVFVHCLHGKDRTGFAVALVQCKYLGKDPREALNEAKKLGFGVNTDIEYMHILEDLILKCKPSKDSNDADIV